MEKFCGFHKSIDKCKTFPVKHFHFDNTVLKMAGHYWGLINHAGRILVIYRFQIIVALWVKRWIVAPSKRQTRKLPLLFQPFPNDDVDIRDIHVHSSPFCIIPSLQEFPRAIWHLTCIYWWHVYAREHIFFLKINVVDEPWKFSSELKLICPSTKLFHLKRFAIYGITSSSCHIKFTTEKFSINC